MKRIAYISCLFFLLILLNGKSLLVAQDQGTVRSFPYDTLSRRRGVAQTDIPYHSFPGMEERTCFERVVSVGIPRNRSCLFPAPGNRFALLRTEVRYDARTHHYILEKKIGDTLIGMPMVMTPEEYLAYRLRQGQISYFRRRNAIETQPKGRGTDSYGNAAGHSIWSLLRPALPLPLSPSALQKRKEPLASLFGAGGVRLTLQGSAEISAGLKRNVTHNPTLPQRARKRNMFDFGQQIQLSMNAKVGDKIDFDIRYDNEAAFDFDAKRIKLAYRGEEDDILKNIEAGNVSMNTTNSLINGGAALFGIKSELQFGKLKINTILSQQQSQSQTVRSEGGVRTIPFEFFADQYDENRHFFLGYFFRERYDEALSKLPYVQSPVSITKIEVWVTNRRGDYDQTRNIVAFADLGEHRTIHNPVWQPQGDTNLPYNRANTLYEQLITLYPGAREIGRTIDLFPKQIVAGVDYEKLENARLLKPEEYTLQPQLGYLSLRMPLQADEVLAVAFEFTCNGKVYQVGEFSHDVESALQETEREGKNAPGGNIQKGNREGENVPEGSAQGGNIQGGNREAGSARPGNVQNGALFVKLLKPVSFSPKAHTWDLMMKNIYAIGYDAYNIQSDRFKMEITYRNDSTGVYLNYLPEQHIGGEQLLRVMHLDRLNGRNDPYPDGIFDFLPGYTIDTENGRIIFPITEPFGSHLRKKIGNDAVADRYVYQELYDSTLTVARQVPEKNKFRMSGSYSGSSGSEINLNALNIARGSVRVTAAGVTLKEGTDYTVDYISGIVKIINTSLLDAGTPIDVSLENQLLAQMQRKTLMGINLSYDLTKELSLGATLMHYYEKPLTMKTAFGDESARNTLWGANLSYRHESVALTSLLDRLPFVEATAPSHLSLNMEYGRMIPGHYTDPNSGTYSYLDDFEASVSAIDLHAPYSWSLAATPLDHSSAALFPEAALSNHTDYGKNRALMAWFYIDGIFTRRNSNLTPAHIQNDPDQLSDHRVREIYEREIFPNRDATYGHPATIPVLNISYYPNERGPYNLDSEVDDEGRLLRPETRWGGISRKMETRDFEAANIEYIAFWLMDPFVGHPQGATQGGDLYINLGEISEDILKDGKKFYENGLPINGDTTAIGQTVWGKYPKHPSTVYAFDNSGGMEARKIQDVGLNGLSSEEEKRFPTYATYLERLQTRLSPATIARMQNDPHSPLNDPGGDNFRHYRGVEQDNQRLTILERYKYYNGTEGNSLAPEQNDPYASSSRSTPDREEIDNDNTMNENEAYYQYKIALRPETMERGSNFITDKREVSVQLRNGQSDKVTWYQFKIPIRDYQSKVGNIEGFNNIRFMRLFLTGFREPVFLRFATLSLMRSEWRVYRKDLVDGGPLNGTGNIEIATVNIEENGHRTPVNYVLPPGVTRILDPSQPQLRQENEQSLSLKVSHLNPGDSRSIYKSSMFDLRRYKRLQMFVHAERLPDLSEAPEEGDLAIFLRLGSDYRNNYYEYEIPLCITPEGKYSSNNAADKEAVWPRSNMFDFPLDLLTDLKLRRNGDIQNSAAAGYFTPYGSADPENPENRITIMGNPTLAEVKVMMIGIRNRSDNDRSAEVWVDELRLSEFDERGGWAAQGNLSVSLSDIGNIHLSARKETAGFGALDQKLLQRRNDDYTSLHLALNIELGRFFPKRAKIKAPLYFSYSDQITSPLYDPFNQDLLLTQSLRHAAHAHARDSIRLTALTRNSDRSFSLSNVKMEIRSKTPMPYDPANFTFGYSANEHRQQAPDTEYATTRDNRLQADYAYTPQVKPWEPFKNLPDSIGRWKWLRSFNLNYLPNSLLLNSKMVCNYRETQLRDLNPYASGMTPSQQHYLTFSHNFFWNRNISLTWDLTRNLKTSFHCGTIAEIEEPYLQVNKRINRSDYEIWKDSVIQSILHLGRPLNYEQTADISYTLPFAETTALSWISSNVTYHSRYRWERGAFVADEEIGNFLQNDLSLTWHSRFNLQGVYRKIPLLLEISNSFNNAGLERSDTLRNFRPPKKSNLLLSDKSFLRHIVRMAMMVQNINLNMGYKTRTDLPGFRPMAGDFFGQRNSPSGLLPGLGFAFGFEGGERFVEKAKTDNLLVINDKNITPALSHQTKEIRTDALIEPLPGIRINLNALYEEHRRTEIRYMYKGMPPMYGGSFALTLCALPSAFGSGGGRGDYPSRPFETLRANREIIASRLRKEYEGSHYPQSGFLTEGSYHGTPFNPSTGDVPLNSADVLIPAFLAAYTGRSPHAIALTPFPDIRAWVPNWDVSCNLTTLFPRLQHTLKTLMLTHKYISQYRIGSYGSFLSWVPSNGSGNRGYIRDAVTGAPIPSSPYDIGAVTITESFQPLIELRGQLYNDLSITARINKTRTMNLNIASYQLVETGENDLVLGVGYRMTDFNRIIGFGSNSKTMLRKRPSSRKSKTTERQEPETPFNNDLNIRLDLSYKKTEALIRKIEEGFTQATGGLQTTTLRFSADYAVSRSLALRAFFDKTIRTPLVSATAYPTSDTNAGISLRIQLNQ